MSGEAVAPGGVVGILGGGQLGRMLALAAARMGLRVHVYAPEEDPPAGQVCARIHRGVWDDAAALEAFARAVDVVTYEFENVPAETIDAVEPFAPVRPGRRALATAQDRLAEKEFLSGVGLELAPFAAVEDEASLEAALERVGTPSILKTRRMGYDGKGQAAIRAFEDAAAALAAMQGAPAVLEAFVEFRREISVIGARGLDRAVACYDPGENEHRDHILRRTNVPGAVTAGRRADAALIAGRILNALDYIGVIGVELFETERGLLVNEIAPRVHNSGHWTQDACAVDQFEQHIRAICGWPLGDGSRFADAEMVNLIGDEAGRWREIAAAPGDRLHLYGKAEARPGRKMGHVNRIAPRAQ